MSLRASCRRILGLAGLVGSGRTELARLIFGADIPTGGTIEIDGAPVRFRRPADAISNGIALLPEDRRHEGLVLNFSTRENITLASLNKVRRHRLVPMPSRTQGAGSGRGDGQTALDRHGGTRTGSAATLGWESTEGRAREMAAGLVSRLIFDEPSQGVDVGAKAEIFNLIERLAAEGRSVIVISSDFAELAAVCTRVIGIREGRVSGVVEAPAITEPELIRLAYAPKGAEEAAVLGAVGVLP